MNEVKFVDISVLNDMADGDAEFIQEMVTLYTEDTEQQLASLRELAEQGDAQTFERVAHTIKGASANVGADAVSALALEMEKEAKAGDLNAAADLIDSLSKTHASTVEEFTRLIADL